MAAFSKLPDGTVVRWHIDYAECSLPACPEYHLTRAELMAPDPEADRARGFSEGLEHRP